MDTLSGHIDAVVSSKNDIPGNTICIFIGIQVAIVVMLWVASIGWAIVANLLDVRFSPMWAEQWRNASIWNMVAAYVFATISIIVGTICLARKETPEFCATFFVLCSMLWMLHGGAFAFALDLGTRFVSKPDFTDEGTISERWEREIKYEASILAAYIFKETTIDKRPRDVLRSIEKDYKNPGWFVELINPIAPKLFKGIRAELEHPDYDITAIADTTRVDGRGYISFIELRPTTFDGPSASPPS